MTCLKARCRNIYAVWSHLEVRDPVFYPSGEEVIVSRSHVYATARATGRPVDWPLMQFFRVRNARIVELPGQGHMANITAPELTARALLDFLNG